MLKGKLALAYTAGIIDGEGCISVAKRRNKTKRGFSYELFVMVTSTDEWLTQWLKWQYGGGITLQKGTGRDRDLWKWSVTARKARNFLLLILPYLNLKQPQAELAISFESKNTIQHKSETELAVLEAERILLSKMKGRLQ